MALQNLAALVSLPPQLVAAINLISDKPQPVASVATPIGETVPRGPMLVKTHHIISQWLTLGPPAAGFGKATSVGIDLALLDANGVEVTTAACPGYTRLLNTAFVGANWTVGNDGLTISNAIVLTFAAASALWASVFKVAVAVTGNSFLVVSNSLSAAVACASGNQLSFPIGSFQFVQSIGK